MTTDTIMTLRRQVGETRPDTAYDDDALQAYLDTANGSSDLAAALVWEDKAAGYAALVNTSESGSSRSMGDLYKNALAMADRFRKLAAPGGDPDAPDAPVPFATRTRTRPIVRA